MKRIGGLGVALALIVAMLASAPVAAKENWDHVANIKDAAVRLAALHKREGSAGVLKFLDACYKTQLLSSKFSQGLESCMAQDYMHTQVLALIYSRIPEAERKRVGAPSPQELADNMGRRLVTAFSQYKKTIKDAEAFRKLVDKNGMPLFIKSVFSDENSSGANKSTTPDEH
jgi:hypothetical protein